MKMGPREVQKKKTDGQRLHFMPTLKAARA